MKKHGFRRWMAAAFLIAAAFSLALTGCSGDDGSQGPAGLTGPSGPAGPEGPEGPAATTDNPVTVQGNVAGTAPGVVPAAQLAALTSDTAVVMVDEAGNLAASQMVTPANGQFFLSVPSGHVYVMVFREGSLVGRTLGVLIVDSAAGRSAFSIPHGTTSVNLGSITIDPKRGRATCGTELSRPGATTTLPDADGDGIPDVADRSDDEDGDGVADSQDRFCFDETESEDTDGDGIGDNADDDDDGDGVADADDDFPKDPGGVKDPTMHLPYLVRQAALAAGLDSLANVPVPMPENLNQFLLPGDKARLAAIQLGKALFWDMQVGSDGQACASCHFHAGADSRAKNQLNPGLKAGDGLFGNTTLASVPGFPQFGPNYELTAADFPFHLLEDPEQENYGLRTVLRDTNDVVSSQGVFAANFTGIVLGQAADVGDPIADTIYNVAGVNVRRVEPRNTPTTINAVFYHSNFWDGRAHNEFNGVSPIGPLDEEVIIWVDEGAGPVPMQVRIPNSSLASQAVGPPLSDLEMSFFDRPFPEIGKKLFSLRPLGLQFVHPEDSVLGGLSNAWFENGQVTGRKGLVIDYATLIKKVFRPEYWAYDQPIDGYIQMEKNFSLFFGLAVQMYESTLVAERTPFDLFMEGDDEALSEEQLQGLMVFINRGARGNPPEVDAAIAKFAAGGVTIGAGNCSSCHGGPELTDASVASVSEEPIEVEETSVLVDGLLQIAEETAFIDNGFANIGVRPSAEDLGRGGEEGGFPLSFARQALQELDFAPDDLPLDECGDPPLSACPIDDRVGVDGAFKIPGLRNVELTGPYFHNGGQATLEQVVEFYDRQGDFGDVNVAKLERNMAFIAMADVDEEPLVEFLLALTDERVREEQAPFDRPQLFIPNGHLGSTSVLECANGLQACDELLELPPVGAGGRSEAGLDPLGTFLGL